MGADMARNTTIEKTLSKVFGDRQARRCMGHCGRMFVSESKSNRICNSCAAHNALINTASRVEGERRRKREE